MKKTITTIAILLGIALCATAQNGGLFQRGTMPDEAYYENGHDRSSSGLLLPNGHGQDNDADAPLGGGIAVLVGLGAAYALGKKREKE